ncbi:ARM repeat-containing protein [Exidia glandulosa HHB12029]|uniref:ARM repeat-containing protein n=1 Tax=Exidia glandulosa HHB12029 TaxID=1314781 RepID=A0A165L7Z5_EXIGL|nr:ARM repeat-containing protein [Exidia glandulosa HHB12029]
MDEDDEEWEGVEQDAVSDSASISEDGDEAPQLVPIRSEENGEETATQGPATASGRYVPPALRKQQLAASAPSEETLKLTRQLKGLLNRMSEQNIATVLADIEEAYRKHSRHDVTNSLTTLIIDGISSHGAHLDSFVIIHAALVGALHRVVGIEFAAHFVQCVVEKYDTAHSAAKAQEDAENRGKECSNLLSLLAELYALQVVACVLLYDLVRELLAGPLLELDVELLLKLLRLSGLQMRADDPSALKDIVQLVQDKVDAQEGSVGSRTKFMVETLVQLKNGKTKKGQDADGAGARDVVERMKKFLGGLSKKRQVMAHEPIRVGLGDLRNADKRGRWWLVGAAWAGDPLVEHNHQKTQSTKPEDHDALLALARKHGMNTDVRRNIFVVLMSSEDMVDAATRLAALSLSDVQQREVVRVALHCLGAERTYNPFWALVIQRTTTPAQKITLQYALWDFLRGMGESRVGGAEVVKNAEVDAAPMDTSGSVGETKMENVARAYGWWIAKGACALTTLKPLEFELLQPQTRRFVKRLLTHLFISTQVTSPVAPISKATRKREALESVVIHAARVPTLQRGLLFFLNSSFKKSVDGPEGEFVRWAVQIAKETLAAGVDVNALEDAD